MKIIRWTRFLILCAPLLICSCDPRSELSDPVIKDISADIGTPAYFVLMNEPVSFSNGYFSGWNRILRQSDVNLAADRGLGPLLNVDHPTFRYISQSDWLTQSVLHSLVGTGLILQKSNGANNNNVSSYVVSPDLRRTALTGDRLIDHYGSTQAFRIYNLGSFSLKSAEMINEYPGADQANGATPTKFRSYRAFVQFIPAESLRQVYAGPFSEIACVVVVQLDQATLQWQFVSDQCELAKPQ